MADLGTFAFTADVKTKAEAAISRLELEILSSLSAAINTDGVINGYNFDEFEFTAPSVPDIPDFTYTAVYEDKSTEKHTGHVWSATELARIQTALFAALDNGGIGISQALQDSIFNSDSERKLQTLNDSLNLVNAGMGARGFRLPNSMLTGARNEIIQKYQFDLDNQSREITKLMEEHARTNWQFCIERGISSEQYYMDFTKAYNNLFVDAIRASLEKYKADIEVAVASYKAKVEGIISRLQAEKARADVQAIAWSSMLDKAKVELSAETADKQAWLNAKQHEITNRGHAITGYANLVGNYAKMASGGQLEVLTRKG